MILLDTRILVWLDQDTDDLGQRARTVIADAHVDENIAVSAISYWEIGMLVAKGRLEFSSDLEQWRVEMLNAGFNEMPIDGRIALKAASLKAFHGDPADRLIVSTAIENKARLLTADQQILDYRPVTTIDGRR